MKTESGKRMYCGGFLGKTKYFLVLNFERISLMVGGREIEWTVLGQIRIFHKEVHMTHSYNDF